MQVVFRDGVHLPGFDLWLDPHHTRDSAVVTHAHADHMKAHGEVLCTPATAAMMKVRGARGSNFRFIEFGQKYFDTPDELGHSITLLPAGHVLGSSQVLVEHQGRKLLYSGDFKLGDSRSCEPIEVPCADVVVMETTFGRRNYCFPDHEEVLSDIRRWCRNVLRQGDAPVLLCYSLGKGQEILAGLEGVEFPIYLHEAHWKMANAYQQLGVEFPEYRLYEAGQRLDGVLLCASGCRRGRWFRALERSQRLKTAYLSGWALDRGAHWRAGTDVAFPLSDHADYNDLMAYVGLTGAQTIYTMHGFDDEFARDLRAQGYDAQPLKSVAM